VVTALYPLPLGVSRSPATAVPPGSALNADQPASVVELVHAPEPEADRSVSKFCEYAKMFVLIEIGAAIALDAKPLAMPHPTTRPKRLKSFRRVILFSPKIVPAFDAI